ncbi:MAG: rod shape-determining protein MreC [Alphaproteobacteria bacterium]
MKYRISPGFGSKIYIRMAPDFIGGHFSSFIFVMLALAALIFSAVNPAGVSGARSAVSDMVAPALNMISLPSQNAVSLVKELTGLTNLQAENARLEQENARLREWYQTAQLLQNENKSLRGLLNLKIESRHSFITARVLADAGNTFAKNILVMAGQAEGVDKSQAVVSGEGVIGRIIESGQTTSRVLLITDINSRLPVIIDGSQQQAILAGRNDETPMLLHIPADQTLTGGARVITSGLGGIFPPGLPVGRVYTDESGDYRVRLFADFDRLVYVRIVDQPEDPNLYEAGDEGTLD